MMEFLIKCRCFQLRTAANIEDICLGITMIRSQTRMIMFWGLTTSFIIIKSWKMVLGLCWLHGGNSSLLSWSLCYFSQLTLFQREIVFVCLFRARKRRESKTPKNSNWMNENHYKRVWLYSVVGHEKILKSQKTSQDEKIIICTDLFAKRH